MLCNLTGTVLIHVLPPLLLAEFVLGVLGNGLALWIFCFHLRPWKSSTVLLFNLAVADFLLNVALPLRASYYFSGLRWHFGTTLCNVSLFMLAMNRSGSAFFLMAIAVDRYMRVVHPHHPCNYLSVWKAALGAFGLWMITISMDAHIVKLQHSNTSFCESFNTNVEPEHYLSWHEFTFLFSFFIPLLVILFCTVNIVERLRRRQLTQHTKVRRALCFVVTVVVLFVICFLPSNITLLIIWIRSRKASGSASWSQVCPASQELANTFYVSISLTYLNSALDPLVYYFSSSAFKNACRKVVCLPRSDSADGPDRRTREMASQSQSQL